MLQQKFYVNELYIVKVSRIFYETSFVSALLLLIVLFINILCTNWIVLVFYTRDATQCLLYKTHIFTFLTNTTVDAMDTYFFISLHLIAYGFLQET